MMCFCLKASLGGDEDGSSERDGLNNLANRVQNYEAVNEVTTDGM